VNIESVLENRFPPRESIKLMNCRCGKTYKARKADLKRGWGLSCSKSCAKKRSNKGGAK
jgi:hypothetical protein